MTQAHSDFFEHEVLFKRLVEQSIDGLLVMDHNGIVLYANPAAKSMFASKLPDLEGYCFGIPAINKSVELVLPDKDKVRHVEMRSTDFEIEGRALILASLWDITERKLSEDSIREREALLQKIFDILPVGLWFADQHGNLLRGNPAGVEIWGAEPKVGVEEYGVFKARRLPSMQEIAPNDWALVHAIRDGKTTKDELLEIDRFGGEKRIVMNSVSPVIGDDGAIQGAVVINQDVTERIRAEEELKESELRFRSLADAGSALVWTSNINKECDYFNQIWLAFTGRTFEQEYGFGWAEGVHPDDYHRCVDIYTRAFDSRKKFSMVYRLRRCDGEYRWIQDDGTPRYNSKGEFLGYIGHCLDITERRESELALARSEEQLRTLIDRAPDAVFVCIDHLFVFLNKTALKLFAADSPEQLINRPIIERVHPDFRNLSAFRQQSFTSEDLTSELAESKMLRLDGSELMVEISTVPITYQQKSAALFFVRNVEERNKLQAERDHLNLQLAQAQKMESIGRLAGGVAHDFNNMLQVILGEADLIISQLEDNSQLAEAIKIIKSTAIKSTELTRQLLTFARQQRFAPRLLNLNDAINSVLKMLRRLIGEDIELVWKPGYNLRSIKIDPSQLDQILANLAVNARDAISDVGVIIIETKNETIETPRDKSSLSSGLPPGEYVVLSISDSGCGMSDDIIEKIFDPFFSTKERGKGTGLGLATVYGIVGQNGGEIRVYSEPGLGTTFKLYFKSEQAQPQVEATHAQPRKSQNKPGTETILIVEDEALILEFARKLLTNLGYNVLTADTPAVALSIAQNYPDQIHLLVTDIIMPEMNGRELSWQIAAMRKDLKSLYISGYTAGIIEEHGIISEGVNFLEKPFSARALSDKIREILDQD